VAAAASTEREVSTLGGAHFTPAEADLRGVEGGGLASESPATRPSWARRKRAAFENSVWAPVALKLFGLALGMLALAAVGVASILSGLGGVQVPLAGMLGNDIHSAWLANRPAASGNASAGTPAGSAKPVQANATGAPVTAASTSTDSSASTDSGTSARATSAGMTEDGKVILNLASIEDLRHLPGVGPKRAVAILALRTRLGQFKHVNDLLRVKGIGVKGLKKILPHVVLDGPKPVA
jgi:competence protein ComEA